MGTKPNIVIITTFSIEMSYLQDKFKNINIEVLKTTKTDGVEVLQIQTVQGNAHKIFVQEIDLDNQRSVKIQKTDLGELNSNSWIALMLLMKGLEPTLYLIPSTEFLEPDNFIFIENNLRVTSRTFFRVVHGILIGIYSNKFKVISLFSTIIRN